MPFLILFILFFGICPIAAQESFVLQLDEVEITAGRIVRGDGDTYGLGDWHCRFEVSLTESTVLLEGRIVFAEKANDHTTISGTFKKYIPVKELEACRHCVIQLDPAEGTVSGPNIGARGYRMFAGQGLIRRAHIQTDVLGQDAGRIGGTVQFAPIRVLVDCLITMDGGR